MREYNRIHELMMGGWVDGDTRTIVVVVRVGWLLIPPYVVKLSGG